MFLQFAVFARLGGGPLRRLAPVKFLAGLPAAASLAFLICFCACFALAVARCRRFWFSLSSALRAFALVALGVVAFLFSLRGLMI